MAAELSTKGWSSGGEEGWATTGHGRVPDQNQHSVRSTLHASNEWLMFDVHSAPCGLAIPFLSAKRHAYVAWLSLWSCHSLPVAFPLKSLLVARPQIPCSWVLARHVALPGARVLPLKPSCFFPRPPSSSLLFSSLPFNLPLSHSSNQSNSLAVGLFRLFTSSFRTAIIDWAASSAFLTPPCTLSGISLFIYNKTDEVIDQSHFFIRDPRLRIFFLS